MNELTLTCKAASGVLGCSEKLIAHNASRAEAGLAEQQPEQIVAEYIRLLTEYNSVKDAVQVIFDKVRSHSIPLLDSMLASSTLTRISHTVCFSLPWC